MLKNKTQRLTVASMLIALGIILPYFTSHAAGMPGTVLLPMHIPVLLSGFLCGPVFGVVCGVLTPILSSLLTNMPTAFPMLPIMVCELAVYGGVSGAMMIVLKNSRGGVIIALLCAMLSGRVAYGIVFACLTSLYGQLKALSVWGAVTTGLPGILIQIIFVPTVVFAVKKIIDKKK
jgi:riboflavin transporter FmnP